MALEDFPRYPLMFGPSPVHPLPRLSAAPRRRADLGQARGRATAASPSAATRPASSSTSSPTRSPRAPTRSCRSAAYQSNHTRQVAAVAAKLGLKAVLVQENWVDWPDSVNDRVGNILLSRIMGAEVRLDPAGFDIGFRDSWNQALDDVARARRHAVRHPGRRVRPPARRARASPTGRTRCSSRSRSSASSSTRSSSARSPARTHAGMIAGFAGQDRPRRVIGIDASATIEKTREQVARIARNTAELIEPRPRPARRRDHRARGLGGRPLRHPRRSRRSTPSGSPAASRA